MRGQAVTCVSGSRHCERRDFERMALFCHGDGDNDTVGESWISSISGNHCDGLFVQKCGSNWLFQESQRINLACWRGVTGGVMNLPFDVSLSTAVTCDLWPGGIHFHRARQDLCSGRVQISTTFDDMRPRLEASLQRDFHHRQRPPAAARSAVCRSDRTPGV